MNIEIVKTYILILLVVISLVLTLALSNNQPKQETIHNATSEYVNEVDLGGQEETKHRMIEPRSIIFHNNERYYGFSEQSEEKKLYHDMQEWALDDVKTSVADGPPTDDIKVEVAFPTAMPVEVIKSAFNLNTDASLPDWSFQRMFITFNQSESILNVHFISTDDRKEVTAIVRNTKLYNTLRTYMTDDVKLSEFMTLNTGHLPIYFPVEGPEMKARSFAFNHIDTDLLVNALFNNPSSVNLNAGEAYYTDGQRGMEILNDGESMEFVNPIHSNKEHKDAMELLEQSLSNINGHKGWTDKYFLEEIDTNADLIRYQMKYDDYPVFNSSGLTVIEQQWFNQELHSYKRPLFSLNNLLTSDVVSLPSGKEVSYYLETNDYYIVSDIQDVRIGYKLTYSEQASYSVILEPSWYVKYNDEWQEIKVEDLNSYKKGGS